MFKVLIADDEQLIREGLRDFVDWARFDMRVECVAENGRQAIELIDSHKPDICILDIRMPFVDGLEVAEYFNKSDPGGVAIFFTGHDDFEYAVRALRASAFDFIKKPLNMPELVDVLERASEHMKATRQNTQSISRAMRQIDNNFDVMRRSFLLRWFDGKISGEEVVNGLSFYNLDFAPPCGIVYTRITGDIENSLSAAKESAFLAETVIDALNVLLEPFDNFFNMKLEPDNAFLTVLSIQSCDNWQSLEKNASGVLSEKLGKRVDCLMRDCGDAQNIKEGFQDVRDEMNRNLLVTPILQALLQHIHANYSNNNLMMTSFAQENNVNSSYLSRLFKSELGQSYSDYLTAYRINKSLGYLANPDMKIYRIAELVGYQNQYYFSESFKKNVGMSPSDYRKKMYGIKQ